MSTATDKAKAARAAKRAKGRKNTKPEKVVTPRIETNNWWKSSDLSLARLDLRTVDKKAAKKSAKTSAKTRQGKVTKKPLSAAAKKKAERQRKLAQGRRNAEPIRIPQKLNIAESVTDASVDLTIDGASTLTVTVSDPDKAIVGSGIFDRDENGQLDAIDVKLDTQWFRLVSVDKQGLSLTLVFEDRPVAYLRTHSRFKWISRSDKTRAQFIHSLVTEVRAVPIKFFCPEETIRQPIASTDVKTGTTVKRTTTTSRTSAAPTAKNLQGKEGSINMANARRVFAVLDKLNVTEKVALATAEACIVEAPDFANPSDGEGTSVGILQLINIHYGGSVEARRNIERVIKDFCTKGFTSRGGAIALAKAHPSWSAGQIAQACQGSAYPDRYDQYEAQAKKIVTAMGGSGSGGGESSGTETTTTRRKQYRFARGSKGKAEASWDAIQRLAKEVNWRAFMHAGELWFVSDDWLLAQVPLAVINENTRWVDKIDYEWDNGKTVQSVTLTCRAERWAFLPGSTVAIDEPGPALGRWIVTKVSRPLSSRTTTVTLSKKSAKYKEPAPDTQTNTVTKGGKNGTDDDTGTSGSVADKVYNEGLRISNQGKPYGPAGHVGSWAGAKAAPNQDCSSSTSLALHAAGLMPTSMPQVSDYFRSWGKPGKGEDFTVWVKPGGGPNGHVFIEFYNRKYQRFDTSPQGSGGRGARMRTGARQSYAGFSPRHA